MLPVLSHTVTTLGPRLLRRSFAYTVDGILRRASAPPEAHVFDEPRLVPNELDSQALSVIRRGPSDAHTSLKHLIHQYDTRARIVLDTTLAYEHSPPELRRIDFDADDTGVALLAHVAEVDEEHKVTFCSGFAIKADEHQTSSLVVSCAHTLEEMRLSRMLSANTDSTSRSATLIFHHQSYRNGRVTVEPASNVLTSLPRSDLVVFAASLPSLRTLPISLYPAPIGTRVRVHLVSESKPKQSDWRPWIYGTWHKWAHGKVLGYRDFSGREAEPGTYDALFHLLFDPPPLPGSSGGPIVAEESGAVIGVVLGNRMDNRVEGIRGWGVPSEVIYEMFKLPGLELDR
ncbi:hypothetical protein K439DRAFT_1614449 [Ramaria rubella]|nr:hypothetical protein K439DRAFT_1614449 [Ramaria rubella]